MEFVIEGETCARIMLTVERMERSVVLMAVRKTVLNLVTYSAQKSVILMLSA